MTDRERERIEGEIKQTATEIITEYSTYLAAGWAGRVYGLSGIIVAIRHQRAEGLRHAAEMALAGLKGQPKPYNWAKQNYNGGWDQSRHNLARELRAAADEVERGS